MSKLYYARYGETEEEIVGFPTKQQRDDWVNFKDEFSLTVGTTLENCIFTRMALSTEEAEHIIKAKDLSQTQNPLDLDGENIVRFQYVDHIFDTLYC